MGPALSGFVTLGGLALLGVVLLLVPGTLLLRLFGFTWTRSLLAGPVISGALYLALAVLLGLVGVRWGWGPVLILWLVLAAAVVVRERRSANPIGSRLDRRSPITRSAIFWGLGALAVFLLVQIPALVSGMGAPNMFPQIGDAQFHLQGARLVYDSGNANPFTALSPLYFSEGHTYYPTLWHSLVVLLSFGGDLVAGTNAMAMAVGLLLWPASLWGLAQGIRPRSPYVGAIAILAATPLVLMPGIQVFAFGVYPFVLSLTFLGPALLLLLWWMRERRWIQLGTVALAALGGGAAQPATGALLVGIFAVALLVLSWNFGLGALREGARGRGLLLTAGSSLVFVGALLVAPQVGPLRSLGGLGHPSVSYREAGTQLLAGNVYFIVERPFGGKPALLLWGLILLILLLGLIQLCRSLEGATLLSVAAVLLAAYFLASGPENYLRRLTGIWWKDQTRFALYLLVILLVAFAVGFTWLLAQAGQLIAWRPLVPAFMGAWLAICAVSAVPLNWLWLGDGRAQWIDRTYGGITGGDFDLSADNIELLRDLGQYLGPDDVVVGSPRAGVPWVNILSEAGQFPLWKTETAPEEVYLRDHFDQINSDPEVCRIINENHITALLRDEGKPLNPDDPHRAFVEVDISDGFRPIANRGQVWLYEITACAGAQ